MSTPPEDSQERREWNRAFYELRREMAVAFRRSFGGQLDDGEWAPWDEDEAGREALAVAAMLGVNIAT